MMKTVIEKQRGGGRGGWTVRGKQGEWRKKDKEGGDRMENSVGV